jgi:glycolate oxidase iron-sulfur subunit
MLGNELDSPRGRIQIIQQMLERDAVPDAQVVTHIDRCLSCNACVSACPSGVNYPRLIDAARFHVERKRARPILDRAFRTMLGVVLPRRWLLAHMLCLARKFASASWAFPARLKGLTAAALQLPAPRQPAAESGVASSGERVALHMGCVQEVVAPHVSIAAARVLRTLGFDPVRVEGEGCCGALNHHLGQEGSAQRRAAALCADISSAGKDLPLQALVVTASGCGTAIRDFGHHLDTDEARVVSRMTLDIMQLVGERLTKVQDAPATLRVAYHFPCSLQHGMKGADVGPAVLRRLGFEVIELKDRNCCGSAGTYNILQPEIAEELRRWKVDEISSIKPDVIVSGNIGCMSQLSKSLQAPVLHPVELVDWAINGKQPRGLENRLRVERGDTRST